MRRFVLYLGFATILAAGAVHFALAQSGVDGFAALDIQNPAMQAEVDALNQSIADRKAQLADLNNQIDLYKKQIAAKESEQRTLQDEMDLLTTRIARTALDIQAAQAESDAVNAEITVLDKRAMDMESQLANQRALIVALLQKIDAADSGFGLQTLFSTDSFSDLFDRLETLENVNGDLLKAVVRAKLAKAEIAQGRVAQQAKRDRLLALADSLRTSRDALQNENGSKQQLLDETQSSESRFQALLKQLKNEQAQTNDDVRALQDALERKLRAKNPAATSALAWPVDASYRGLSVLFNDPTYPFRNLFEHTGIDVPEPQGTPVRAAAAGYVAWVRLGQLYGNYVMIVHADGIATLYAHLSRTLVHQDQYVNQGDVIARSGGKVGELGSGFSTGPHLHFEVRKDGMPVDPMDYLPPVR